MISNQIEFSNHKLRLLSLSDSLFLYQLRNADKAKRFLSIPPTSLKAQEEWLKHYKNREKKETDFYFIAENDDSKSIGTTRVYNISPDSFEFGSWLFLNDQKHATRKVPIYAFLATVDWAFKKTNSGFFYTTVKPENRSMIRFHNLFKAEIVATTDRLLTTIVKRANFYAAKQQLER